MSDIQMRGPKGCANTLSFDGTTYTAKKGVFTVPAEAVHVLRRHGFKAIAQDTPAQDSPPQDPGADETAEGTEQPKEGDASQATS